MPANSVHVYENMGEWFVIVARDGRETITSFELESFAKAYAEGQRLGLGLGKSGEAPEHGSTQAAYRSS